MRGNYVAAVFVAVAVILACSAVYGKLSAANGAQNITSAINTARFVLFSGEYEVPGQPSSGARESGVFKLDTYTGKVWTYKVSVDKGGSRVEKWTATADPPSSDPVSGKEMKGFLREPPAGE
jgi:hypothetical protein